MRISTFVIGLLIVGLLISTIFLFIAEVGNNYEKSSDLVEINLSSYNKIVELKNESKKIKSEISNITYAKNDFDIIGRLFGAGVQSVKTTLKSFDVGITMTEEAFSGVNNTGGVPLGDGVENIKGFIVASIVIFIFVGIILSVLINREV